MAKECIEREEALRIARGYCHPANIAVEIERLPAADVVDVVRCKDCIHYEMGVCLKIYDDGASAKEAWQERKPDDFCSYGADMREVQDG